MSIASDKQNAKEFAKQYGTQQDLRTTGFAQNAAAAAAQTIAQDLPVSELIAKSSHRERDGNILSRIQSGEIPDELVNQFTVTSRKFYGKGVYAPVNRVDYAALGDHLAAQGNKDIPTQQFLDNQMQDNIDVLDRNYRDITSRQSGWGWLGDAGGSMGTSMLDPVNMTVGLALPATKLVPSNIWSKMGASFVQGMKAGLATEIVTQPLIMDWKQEIGQEYGLKEAAYNATINTFAGGFLDVGFSGSRILYGKGRGMLKSRTDVGSMSPTEIVEIMEVGDEIVTGLKGEAKKEGNKVAEDAAGEIQARDLEVKEELKQSPAETLDEHIEGMDGASRKLADANDLDDVEIVENPFENTESSNNTKAFMDDIEFMEQMKKNAEELDAQEKIAQEQHKASQLDAENKKLKDTKKAAKGDADADVAKLEAKIAKMQAEAEDVKVKADKAEVDAKEAAATARAERKTVIEKSKPKEPEYKPREQREGESENAYLDYQDKYDIMYDKKMSKYENASVEHKLDASERSKADVGETEVEFKPLSEDANAKIQESFDIIAAARMSDDPELKDLLDEDILDYESDLDDINTLNQLRDCMDG